jgi:hypothetical protein
MFTAFPHSSNLGECGLFCLRNGKTLAARTPRPSTHPENAHLSQLPANNRIGGDVPRFRHPPQAASCKKSHLMACFKMFS